MARGQCHLDESNEQMIELTAPQIDYLSSQRLGRIATAGADGKPHVVPTSFRYHPDLGTIDIGGLHVATTKKYRDVQANAWAAIVVDDLVSTDPWTPRMLEIRGRAEAIETGGADLGPGFGDAFIRLLLRRSTASASSDRPPLSQSPQQNPGSLRTARRSERRDATRRGREERGLRWSSDDEVERRVLRRGRRLRRPRAPSRCLAADPDERRAGHGLGEWPPQRHGLRVGDDGVPCTALFHDFGASGTATHDLLVAAGEFGLSFCSDAQAHLSHVSGSNSLHDVDKWQLADFPTYPAQRIGAPMIDDAVLNVECRIVGTHRLGHTLFIGEAVWVRYDPAKSPLIFHGGKYFQVGAQLLKP